MQSLITIAEAVRAGKQSARDVLEKCLDAIAEKNGELNAFIMLDAESARKQAEDIDARIARGEDPGKLAGVPIGVKDIENCIGFQTTQGSLLLKDAPNASNDSIHVARLRAAGAVIVGKTNTPEFGMDGATHNKLWGVTRNPWNPELTPGGSSGGSSAAVASGMVPLATATDAGGSTRQPAAYTGTVGLLPAHGRIPKANGFSNWSCHGAVTRSVLETARYLDVVSCAPPGRRISGMRLSNPKSSKSASALRTSSSRQPLWRPCNAIATSPMLTCRWRWSIYGR
jgi:aspartyl-tRNA(Asn)/glutamyl-tRNA(Gln) amidotransferase subunit A